MNTEQYPPLTEAEVQAEKARHYAFVPEFFEDSYCAHCLDRWPCPTIRLIAERERLEWANA